MQIDCETCPVRGDACGDCVVTVLLGPPELDEREGAAVLVLAERGLIPPLRDPRTDTDAMRSHSYSGESGISTANTG